MEKLLLILIVFFAADIIAAQSGSSRPDCPTGIIRPEYPAAAAAVRAHGRVSVSLLIGRDGSVISAEPVSGHPLLWVAAVKAALATRFKPFIVESRAISMTANLAFDFVINSRVSDDPPCDANRLLRNVKPAEDFLAAPSDVECNCGFGRGESRILVETTTDSTGNVLKAVAINGHPMLKRAAERAARRSRFVTEDGASGTHLLVEYIFNSKGKWIAYFRRSSIIKRYGLFGSFG